MADKEKQPLLTADEIRSKFVDELEIERIRYSNSDSIDSDAFTDKE